MNIAGGTDTGLVYSRVETPDTAVTGEMFIIMGTV